MANGGMLNGWNMQRNGHGMNKKIMNNQTSNIESGCNVKATSLLTALMYGGFAVLLALAPLLISALFYSGAVTTKIIWCRLGVSVLLGLFGVNLLFCKKIQYNRFGMTPIFLGLAIWWIFTSMTHGDGLWGWTDALSGLLWIFAALTLAQLPCHEKGIIWIIYGIVLGGFLAALYGLLQYMNMDILNLQWFGRKMVGKDIMISTFGNANYFTAYLPPIFILVLSWIIITGVKIWEKVIGLIILIVLSCCIVLSGVRTVWIALPISLTIWGSLWWIINRHVKFDIHESGKTRLIIWRNPWIWGSIVGVIVFIFTLQQFKVYDSDWLRLRVKSLSNIHELEERFLVWQVTMQIIRDNPIQGIGAEQFPASYFPELAKFLSKENANQEYKAVLTFINGRNANHTHNDYLQLAAEGGLVYIAIFFWLLASFFYLNIKALFISQSRLWQIRHLGLIVAVIPFLFDMMVNFPLYLPANSLLLGTLIGITLLHLRYSDIESIEKELALKPALRWVVITILTVVVGLGLYGTTRYALSQFYLKQGITAMQSLKGSEALYSLQKSIYYDRTNAQAHMMMGKLLGVAGYVQPALEEYMLAEKYGIDDFEVYSDQAIFLYQQHNYQAAVNCLQKMVLYSPNHPLAHKMLALIYSQYLPDKDKAIVHIEKYLASGPDIKEKKWFQDKLTELQAAP